MENLNQIESEILNKIRSAKDRNAYDLIKTEIFGKKGIITELFKKIGGLEQSKRKEYASRLNSLKTKVTDILEKKLKNARIIIKPDSTAEGNLSTKPVL